MDHKIEQTKKKREKDFNNEKENEGSVGSVNGGSEGRLGRGEKEERGRSVLGRSRLTPVFEIGRDMGEIVIAPP